MTIAAIPAPTLQTAFRIAEAIRALGLNVATAHSATERGLRMIWSPRQHLWTHLDIDGLEVRYAHGDGSDRIRGEWTAPAEGPLELPVYLSYAIRRVQP